MQSDAFDRGLGAVLSYLDDQGNDRPVAYYSYKLQPREEKYSTVEKECLVIKMLCRPSTLILWVVSFADHHSLTWLRNVKDQNPRLTRWSLFLQSYVFRSSTTRATTMGYSHLLLMHRLFFDAGKGGGNVEARVVSDNSDVFLISKEKSSEFQKGRRDKPGMGLEAHFMT